MSQLTKFKFPWLSLTLLLLTYGVFGWLFAQASTELTHWLAEQGENLDLFLEEQLISALLHFLAIALIIVITISLTAPVSIMTFFEGSSLGSDKKAFSSVFIWALIAVLVVCWFEYFTRFLVMVAASILARLDLLHSGYNQRQTFAILVIVAIAGFAGGLFSFHFFGHSII